MTNFSLFPINVNPRGSVTMPDAGFWLVGTFLEIDEKTTLKSWTIMETFVVLSGLIVSIVISIFA